jgi:uncharacterized protein (TIGR02453 family)
VWPPEALEFLRDLEDNNDREWFKANRARYDSYLVEPARELTEQLRGLGIARLFRPYNDARFHARPPIKEHLGVAVGYAGAGGFYFELSLDGLFVGAGLHHPAPDQVERFRAAIDDGRKAAGFNRAVAKAEAAGLALTPPTLKRAPRGYPLDHPRIEHLRRKSFTVSERHALAAWLHEPACDATIRTQLEAARPLVTWLAEHVGPSQNPARR